MKVKELINKLSQLKEDTEVKIGYGDIVENINFLFPELNYIVLRSNVYKRNKNLLWIETLASYGKQDSDNIQYDDNYERKILVESGFQESLVDAVFDVIVKLNKRKLL